MNIVTFGDDEVGYCETVAGGAGAVRSFTSFNVGVDSLTVIEVLFRISLHVLAIS